MAKLIRDLPPKLLAMGDSFDQVSTSLFGASNSLADISRPHQLLHLLRDPSLAVQQSSYDLVVRIAEKHVSDLVVEVELQTDMPPTIALPQELIELLSAKLSPDVLHAPEQYAAVSKSSYNNSFFANPLFFLTGLELPSGLARRFPLLRDGCESLTASFKCAQSSLFTARSPLASNRPTPTSFAAPTSSAALSSLPSSPSSTSATALASSMCHHGPSTSSTSSVRTVFSCSRYFG